jgi:hypothetical protein
MKKLVTLAASAALLGLAILPVAAVGEVGNSCVNETTGPFSTNNCTVNNTTSVTVKNFNDAVIINNVTSVSNTGGNNANTNTLGGTIHTGNSTNNTVVGSVANINTTNITVGPALSGNYGSNNVTGPSSRNNILIRNGLSMDVDNQNTAFVANNVSAVSDTGTNNASTNTGPGSITTGNAALGLQVGTHVNDNLQNLMAGFGGSGGNTAWNGTTGPFSTNNVTLNNTANVLVKNFNDMVVLNNVGAVANTGGNEAKKNTLGGDILTGGATAGVGVDTEGNINATLVSMALGGFGNAGGNSVTGPDVVGDPYNNVLINNAQNITVDNQNNKGMSHNCLTTQTWLGRLGGLFPFIGTATGGEQVCPDPANLGVLNNVDSVSNTGDNSASTGTGPGVIVDGFAQLVQSVLVHINDTLTNIQ